jgi:hypothetical protein
MFVMGARQLLRVDAGLKPTSRRSSETYGHVSSLSAAGTRETPFSNALPRLLTTSNLPLLQRVLGNRVVTGLIPRAALSPKTPVVTTPTHPVAGPGATNLVQRALLDMGDTGFQNAVRDVLRKRDITGKREKVGSPVYVQLLTRLITAQNVLRDPDSAFSDGLQALKDLQKSLEHWKYIAPNLQKECEAVWNRLNNEIRLKIESYSESSTEDEKVHSGALSASALAKAKETELQSLAIGTIVGNVGTYAEEGKSIIPRERSERTANKVPLLEPAVTDTTYATTKKHVAEQGVAICTHFARVAAHMLQGHGVRVDVVSGKGGTTGHAHSYVLLGREGDDVFDINTWGDDCVLIDCWSGALNYEDFEKDPIVIYKKDEWANAYPVTQHEFDSAKGEAGFSRNVAVVKEKERKRAVTDYGAKIQEAIEKEQKQLREESSEKVKQRLGEERSQYVTVNGEVVPLTSLKGAALEKEKAKEINQEVTEVKSWEEAETLAWPYGGMLVMNNVYYEVQSRWQPGQVRLDKKRLQELTTKIE